MTQNILTLTERDFARFVELLENPPPPTAALRKAMAEYQARMAVTPNNVPVLPTAPAISHPSAAPDIALPRAGSVPAHNSSELPAAR